MAELRRRQDLHPNQADDPHEANTDIELAESLPLVVVWMALFCDYMLMTAVIPIFPGLGYSEIETGILFGAKAGFQLLSAPACALFVDSFQLQPLIIGLAIEALSNIVFAASQEYYTWLAARALQGVASSAILSSGFLYVQRVYGTSNDKLGVAMSLVTTGIITGVTVGPPVGGLLYEVAPPLPFFAMMSILGVATVLAVIEHSRSTSHVLSASAAAKHSSGTKLFKDLNVLVTLVALFCANAGIACLETTFGLFLEHEKGVSPAVVGLLFVPGAIVSVAAAKVGGILGNNHGRWKVIMLGMAIQGGFFALGPKTEWAVLIISLLGTGVGMGMVDGCAPALLAQLSELRHGGTGIIYTAQTVAIQSGFLVGSVAGSAVMQIFGYRMMGMIVGGFLVIFSPLMLVNRQLPSGTGTRPKRRS